MQLPIIPTNTNTASTPIVTNIAQKRILVVDNERHIRMLLTQSLHKLSRQGVQVMAAESGTEALHLLDTFKPDLIFLDLMMPGLPGFDVCRLIKSDPKMAGVYIVILSARSQSVDKQMGSISGADEYIVKPFDPVKIAERAQQILSSQNVSVM